MQSPNEMIGQIIAARWRTTKYFGEGTMSYVYQAEDTETGKTIALKLIKNKVLTNVPDLEILAKQAKDYIALNHENIASYYDLCLVNRQLFLFCDFLQGESLSELLGKVGKLSLDRCVSLFQRVFAGLQYAHEKKILHGDLRPSNIFIVNDQFNDNEPKIVDFGFMSLIGRATQRTLLQTTSTHPILGNAPYLSPEQRAGQKIDERSDLYAFGCLMYEAACGKPPFTSRSAMETTYRQKHQAPTELLRLLPLHPLLERYQLITFKLLQTNPKQRYQSAVLAQQDLALLTKGNEKDWQRKANALKEPKFSKLLKYKWRLASGVLVLIALTYIVWQSVMIIGPYTQPWTGVPFDNNKLWLGQDKSAEKPSSLLLQQRDILIAKLSQIEHSEGKTSPAFISSLFVLAQYFQACHQWNEALAKFTELGTLDPAHKLTDPIELSVNLAFCQFMTGDLINAEHNANKILTESAIDDNTKYTESKITALKILGDIYNQDNKFPQAEKMYSEMYKLAKVVRLSKPAEYAYSAALLGDVSRKENKFSQSEQLYKEAIDWGENYIGHEQLFMAKAFYGLALVYYQQGNLKAASSQLKLALPIAIARCGSKNDFVITIRRFSDYLLFHQNIFAWCKTTLENKN